MSPCSGLVFQDSQAGQSSGGYRRQAPEARDVTIATRDHEHSEEMRKALKRIDDLEVLVYQWNLVRDVQEKRAVRHEAREVRTGSRDAAADARQAARADRSEAREIARDAHDGIDV